MSTPETFDELEEYFETQRQKAKKQSREGAFLASAWDDALTLVRLLRFALNESGEELHDRIVKFEADYQSACVMHLQRTKERDEARLERDAALGLVEAVGAWYDCEDADDEQFIERLFAAYSDYKLNIFKIKNGDIKPEGQS